jgi:hypothetical protein
MTDARALHEDEIAISDAAVRRLVDQQFPQWAAGTLVRLRRPAPTTSSSAWVRTC